MPKLYKILGSATDAWYGDGHKYNKKMVLLI